MTDTSTPTALRVAAWLEQTLAELPASEVVTPAPGPQLIRDLAVERDEARRLNAEYEDHITDCRDQEMRLKLTLGILIDAVAEAAFRTGELDQLQAQEALRRAGLTFTRPATQDDVDQDEWGDVEVGDQWQELTPFAKECDALAARERAKEVQRDA